MELMNDTKRPILRIDGFVDPVFTMDPEGRLVEISTSCRGLRDRTPDELRGKELGTLIPKPQRGAYAGFLRSLAAGDPTPALELDLRAADESPRRVEISARPLLENGGLTGYQGQIPVFSQSESGPDILNR